MTRCAFVRLQGNAVDQRFGIWGKGEHDTDENNHTYCKWTKANICNRVRPGRSEKAKILRRKTTGKYCGRGTDVSCRKKEISLLTGRTIIYKKLILPTNWQEALCTASLSPNKVTLDHTLSFTLSSCRSLSPMLCLLSPRCEARMI